jgi:hypothetical protein
VSGNTPPPKRLASRISTHPVGLKVLAFIGYPVQRALGHRRRAWAFYFPIISVMVLSGLIYLIRLLLAVRYGIGSQFVDDPLVPPVLFAMARGDLRIA